MIINLKRIYIPVLTLLFFLPSCSTASGEPSKVTISPASSLTDIMEEIIPTVEDEHDMGVE